MRGGCSQQLNNVRKFEAAEAAFFQSQTMSAQFPLHNASTTNDLKTLERILAEKNVNANQIDDKGWTPLHRAAFGGHEKVVAMLIGADADLNQPDYDGYVALHFAAFQGHAKVVALLIQAGADVTPVTKIGWTSVHEAAVSGHETVVSLLIGAGADLNQASNGDCTALHFAANIGHENVVALLVNAGADLQKYDSDGWTPLGIAARKGYNKIVTLLRQGMQKQEHRRLVSLANLLSPFDLPVLVVYEIYCAAPLYKESIVSRFDAWRVLTAIKQCENF